MTAIYPGTLIIRPICAKLNRDVETFGTMDPYCQIVVGAHKQKTKVARDAGKFPNWQEQFVFKKTLEDMILIAVYDHENLSSDQIIGEGSLPIQRALSIPNWEDWVEIHHHGRKAGEVRLSVTFTPEGPSAYPPVGIPGPAVVVVEGKHHGASVTAYPPQGYPPQGYPPQGYPPQGYPPQGYPPQGYPPQGYPPQGLPPQGYPPQGYPPQGYPPQGYPPQPGYPPYPGYPPNH